MAIYAKCATCHAEIVSYVDEYQEVTVDGVTKIASVNIWVHDCPPEEEPNHAPIPFQGKYEWTY